MPRPVLPALAVLLLASCDNPLTIEGPSTTVLVASGIEQVLELRRNHPWAGTRGGFALTSRLVNRGEAPVTVKVATCHLEYGVDVRSTPEIELLALSIPTCIETPDAITLQPGEASASMGFGGIIQDRGRYTISVRHARDPEVWGRIEVIAR